MLVVNHKNLYRITEIEFYVNDKKHHTDIFCDDDQTKDDPLKWYFMKQNGKSYKAGTYKRVNLTFGKVGQPAGGVHIRSILSLN